MNTELLETCRGFK